MTALERQEAARAFAAALPGAWTDHPWGETVAKVGQKVFAFLGHPESEPGMGVKLPHSFLEVIELPYAKPSGYNLGKSGWASIRFTADAPSLPQIHAWIEESYRAVALKKHVKELDARR